MFAGQDKPVPRPRRCCRLVPLLEVRSRLTRARLGTHSICQHGEHGLHIRSIVCMLTLRLSVLVLLCAPSTIHPRTVDMHALSWTLCSNKDESRLVFSDGHHPAGQRRQLHPKQVLRAAAPFDSPIKRAEEGYRSKCNWISARCTHPSEQRRRPE